MQLDGSEIKVTRPLADFGALFDAAPTPLLVVSPPDWVIVAANQARLAVTGTTRDALIGKKLFEAFPDDPGDPHADGTRNLASSLAKVLRTKMADTMALQRYPLRVAGGEFEERWWHPINAPVLGPEGEVAWIIHSVEDVTEQVLARQAADATRKKLQQGETVIETMQIAETELMATAASARSQAAELEQLYDRSPMGLALLDRELKFVRINEALAEMNGLPVEAHIGRTAWDIVPELRPSAEPALTKVLTSGEPALDVVVTGTTAAKPDVVREWREQFYPLKNTSGEVIGVGIVCDEVTERRALERRLRESEAHLRRVIDQLFAFVGTLTPDGVLTEANQAPIEAGGISREDVIGKPFADAPWWSYDAQVQARLREDIAAAAAGATIRYDVPVAMAADSRVTIDFQLAPLRDDGGNITHLIAYGVVVDDRIAAEAELRALNETLERRVREEASRREAAQQALLQAQKLEALGQLTSGIAHDFNNVIQAISAGFALIMKRTRDPQIIHIAEHSVKAAERGSSIVKQLLSFARQRPLEISRIDLCALLNEAKPLLERSAGAKAKFTLDCPDDIGTVETDPGLLEAALINLVVNARDAICDHGCISVRVSRAVSDTGASHVTIAVEDNGSGMSPEVVARARDPFFTTKAQGHGTGLGLAMVHGFAQQCHGTLRIESEVGKGTVISIDLPQAKQTNCLAPEPEDIGGRKTILLVDDDSSVRSLVAYQLQDMGFHVVEAEDGSQALDLFDRQRARGLSIDAILTDVRMPRMDGPSFVRQVHSREPVPALFMTGYAEAAEINDAKVLSKPFEEKALAAALRSLFSDR